MKEIIKSILRNNRKYFEKGAKLERLFPFYEAVEAVFFTQGRLTSNGPYLRDSLDLKRFMTSVLLILIPHLLFGMYNTGLQSGIASGLPTDFLSSFIRGALIVLPILIVSYTVGLAWETLFAYLRKENINEGFLVTGLLFPLTLPPSIPLWQVAVGISFGVVIGKEIFGGTGRNFLNPALTARAFVFFAYPSKMTGDSVWTVVKNSGAVDVLTGATPLAFIGALPSNASKSVENALAGAGYDAGTLFWGFHSGSIGETSVFLSIVGAVFLVGLGIANYRTIAGGVLGLVGAGFFMNMLSSANSSPWLAVNPFYHLIMGGALFGIVYMATDPVSGPAMEESRWIYGFLIGALIVLVRVFNPAFPCGTMLSILLMNTFAPLIDYFVVKTKSRKRIANVG